MSKSTLSKGGYVEYSSNNSGGHWWLTDDDWKQLELAGWKVAWCRLGKLYKNGRAVTDANGTPKLVPIDELPDDKDHKWQKDYRDYRDNDGRYLGALAKEAYRTGLSLEEAVDEWETVTGKSSCDTGCPCCGPPHSFTEYDRKGGFLRSGPKVSYEAHW